MAALRALSAPLATSPWAGRVSAWLLPSWGGDQRRERACKPGRVRVLGGLGMKPHL